jgi:transcriptional regulator with XRE-family HTH domain
MMHKIGTRVSSLRKERNMSQEELAAVLNVSRQTVSKWETGDTLPDVYNAVAIAKLFHVSLDTLILGTQTHTTETSYIGELRERRRKMNLIAILVGSFGSLSFVLSLILSDIYQFSQQQMATTVIIVMPVLMLCWGFAIWNFIKIGRIGEEIKYLQQVELTTLQHQARNN